jgi:hypothetical protein
MLCNWTVNPFHCILRLCLVVSPLTRLRAVGIYRNAASMFVFPKWNENMHAFLWRCRWPEPDGLRLSHVPWRSIFSSPTPYLLRTEYTTLALRGRRYGSGISGRRRRAGVARRRRHSKPRRHVRNGRQDDDRGE